MATEILMPRQGQSVESCIIIQWNISEGDDVTEGDSLCEVETDKASSPPIPLIIKPVL